MSRAAERRCSEEDGGVDLSSRSPCWAGYELGPATVLAMHQEITRATRLCPLGLGLQPAETWHPGPASQARPLPDFCPWAPDPALRGGGAGVKGASLNTQPCRAPEEGALAPGPSGEALGELAEEGDPRTCLSRS